MKEKPMEKQIELSKTPDEEQGILPNETKEEHEIRMDIGEEEEDIYKEVGRGKLMEDAEIAPEEEGFMLGYEESMHDICANCKKPFPLLTEKEIKNSC